MDKKPNKIENMPNQEKKSLIIVSNPDAVKKKIRSYNFKYIYGKFNLDVLHDDVKHLKNIHGDVSDLTGWFNKNISGCVSNIFGNMDYYLKGDLTSIRGNISNISGKVSRNFSGDVSNLIGDVTGLYGYLHRGSIFGDVSDVYGDVSEKSGDVSNLSGWFSFLRGNLSCVEGIIGKDIKGTLDVGNRSYGDITSIKVKKDEGSPIEEGSLMSETLPLSGDLSYIYGYLNNLHGDVYFTGKSKYQFNMLHGVKHIIKGNHDYKGSFKGVDAELLDPIHQIKIDDKEVVLCHYPIFSWNGKIHGSIHLYGHVHNHEDEQLPLKNAVNIGVDMWGYCPVDFKTILEVIKDKEV